MGVNTLSRKAATKKKVRAAIERMAMAGEPSVLVEGSRLPLENVTGFDYYLVTSDEFAPLAPKGSILNVHTDHVGDYLLPFEIALVAANGRLELRRATDCNGVQVVGSIWEIRRWPGMDINNPY